MKITRISMKNGEMGQPTSVEMASVVERMHNEKVLDAQEQPALVFSATFSRQGIHDMKHMTGLLLMTAKADKRQQTGEWLKEVRQVPYTLLAFRSLDRRELNVVVPVARVDGQEAQNAEEYLHLLQTAQQQAAAVYHSLTGCPLMVQQELTLHSGCLMSYDPECHYHADAQPFPVIIKSEDVLAGYRDAEVAEDGSVNYQSDEDERDRLRMEYYSCLHQVFEQHAADASDEQLLVTLAELCRKTGLEEEPCVMRTLWQSRFEVCEDLVRKIFRAAYSQTYNGRPLQLMNQKERIARTIRDFFDRRYQLRYNEVKQVTEFRPNDHRFLPWRPLTDRDLKRIAFEEMLEGGHGWMIDIELYVGSSLIRRYNPIHEFLSGVGEWDRQHNYIEEYARRLKTDYDRWPHYFHRWLLAMVAQALDMSRDYGNSMVPLLIGSQAMKKSTFCKNILPYSLREYYMDDIKMDNAEQVERVLGRMWLVNIDEYNAKTDREQAKIKRLHFPEGSHGGLHGYYMHLRE